jgi:hypothetical protein
MRKTLVVIAAAGVLVGMTPTAGLAAGNEQSGPTVGNCISDIFYGNEPNIVGPFAPGGPAEQEPGTKSGRVVPSQSPGPKVTNPVTGEVTPGRSIGDYQQLGISIPALCQAAFGPSK